MPDYSDFIKADFASRISHQAGCPQNKGAVPGWHRPSGSAYAQA
jgi:hypothetical protein